MLWTVIPAKRPDRAKTRLAGALPDAERAALVEVMALRTVALALEAGVGKVLLVSDSEALCAAAGAAGAVTLLEDRGDDLNAALKRAEAALAPADAMLVLPADLPRLEAGDIQAMTAAAAEAAVVIAPDRQESGTNALLWAGPPRAFRFGQASFAAHQDAAREAGATLAVVRRHGLAFDLDLPEDLAELRRSPPPWLGEVLRES